MTELRLRTSVGFGMSRVHSVRLASWTVRRWTHRRSRKDQSLASYRSFRCVALSRCVSDLRVIGWFVRCVASFDGTVQRGWYGRGCGAVTLRCNDLCLSNGLVQLLLGHVVRFGLQLLPRSFVEETR